MNTHTMRLQLRRVQTILRLHVTLRWHAWRADRHRHLAQTHRDHLAADADRVDWLTSVVGTR